MPLCIIRDTREQRGWDFACITPPPQVVVATLASGDYSLLGLENSVAIERKGLSDLFGTFGQGRDRFERELARLAQMRFSAVVIEASFDTIIFRPPARSRLKPKTVIRSMAAWAIRHNVHFYWCPNRAAAEKWTFILLERFWNDLQTGKIKI
jgi:DNA excision repair protein ERCC-4